MDEIKPWMYRSRGEIGSLLFSFILLFLISIIFSYFNFYLTLGFIIFGLVYTRIKQGEYLGNSLVVHATQFPNLYKLFRKNCELLEISNAGLFITQDPYINAYTLGFNKCSVVLSSALVEQLEEEEINFVIAHELGHFRAGHTKIISVLPFFWQNNIFSKLIFGFWMRKSEFTADRSGLIIIKKFDVALNTMIKLMIGGNLYKKIDMEGFKIQYLIANGEITSKYSELILDHPLLTNRIKSLNYFWKENFKQI